MARSTAGPGRVYCPAMAARSDDPSLRWSTRTIPPPGNTEALRRGVADRPGAVMLESVARDTPAGRYSIFGWEPIRVITVQNTPATDPFAVLTRAWRPWCQLDPAPDLPFVGGWIGTIAYEAGRFIEPRAYQRHAPAYPQAGPPGRHSGLGLLPVAHWALFDTVLIHDAHEGRWIAAGLDLPPKLGVAGRPPIVARLDALERFVASSGAGAPAHKDRQAVSAEGRNRWNVSRDAYLAKVERTLEYIRAGDIFQANIARCRRIDVAGRPIDIYQRLCEANPAAYAAYLDIAGFRAEACRHRSRGVSPRTGSTRAGSDVRHEPSDTSASGHTDPIGPPISAAVLSCSPELFLRLRGRDVVTRPIKGTRPRGGSPSSDAAARQALARSEKDRAELNMIVDLQRNDLGRVCEFGTVRVAHEGELETHPTVFHRTATVIGRLRPDADAIDLLRATFPGGSVTGAPKVRAMQIINELEPDPRGPYCGAIGYVGLNGDMQLSLAIRTMTVVENPETRRFSAFLHVGSGIVADSVPEDEYAELQAKAAGMFEALGVTADQPATERRPAADHESCKIAAQPP